MAMGQTGGDQWQVMRQWDNGNKGRAGYGHNEFPELWKIAGMEPKSGCFNSNVVYA